MTLDLSPDGARPVVNVHLLTASGSVQSVDASGTLLALGIIVPYPHDCDWLEGTIQDGIGDKVKSTLQGVPHDPDLEKKIADEVNAKLNPADLTRGPVSNANITLPGGTGFGLNGARYKQTAPTGHLGGKVWIHHEGIDLAANLALTDQGGTRFPFSPRPSETSTVLTQTHGRTRGGGLLPPIVTNLGSATTARTMSAGLVPPIGVAQPFDMGLILNGASVNQLSRALTAGKPYSIVVDPGDIGHATARFWPGDTTFDVGLLDMTTKVDANGDGADDLDVQVKPSVAPIYVPSPPAGWPAPGNVPLYVPSLRISLPAVPDVATMAADVRVGVNASIDPATNHLLPSLQSTAVAPRFLRLGASINMTTDPAAGGIVAIAATKIQQAVPERVKEVLRPIQIPDLSSLLAMPGVPAPVLRNLTVGTVGGGHLGVHFDVDQNPTTVSVGATWTGGSDTTPPTSFTAHVTPTNFPGTGPYTVKWTIRDARDSSLVYQSPAIGDSATSKTFPASTLDTQVIDPCFGERFKSVRISATVTRNGVTNSGSGESGFSWTGTATQPPHLCDDPPPGP